MPTIHPPSIDQQVILATAYLFTAAIGFTLPLTSYYGTLIERQLGWVAVVWIAFMLTAVPAAASTLIGHYRIEYVALPLFGASLLVSNILGWIHTFAAPEIDFLPRACAASALVLMLAWRWRALNRLVSVLQWTKPLHKH